DLAAVEGEHADRLPLRIDGKDEGAVHARPDCDGALRHARVPRHVGDPDRVARLPYLARDALTRFVGDALRALDVQIELRAPLGPGLGESQEAGPLVQAEKAPALPVLRFADRAYHRLESGGSAVGLRHAVRDRMLEPE